MSHRSILPGLGALSLLAASLVSGAAQAALVDRGGGLIYDTDLNVTWLQDANYAKTSGYDADGVMTWNEALTWADTLTYYDSVRGVTYDDWRLPATLQPDPSCGSQFFGTSGGYGCTGSELGHLFYSELGGVANDPNNGDTLAAHGLFSNLTSGFYWSGTAYEPASADFAWGFYFADGSQLAPGQQSLGGAWAVRPGDVAAVPGVLRDTVRGDGAVRPGDVAAVPEAETYAMLLAGLGLIAWRLRRRG